MTAEVPVIKFRGLPIPRRIASVFFEHFGQLDKDFFVELSLSGGIMSGYILVNIWLDWARFYQGDDPDYWLVIGTWRVDDALNLHIRFEDELTVWMRLEKVTMEKARSRLVPLVVGENFLDIDI